MARKEKEDEEKVGTKSEKKDVKKEKSAPKKETKGAAPKPEKKAKAKEEEESSVEDEELESYLNQQLRMGFEDPAGIVDGTFDYYEKFDAAFKKRVRSTFENLQTSYKNEMKTWPKETDCDRLDKAFASLEKKGIVARQDFTCCQTCGHAEIGEQIEEYEKGGKRKARGYTFYHRQDTERAVEDGCIYLAYGAMEDGDAATLEIGREIKQTIIDAGFQVEWKDDIRTRILIQGLDWKRRMK